MKDKTACFTGHRDIPPLKRPGIKHRLEREIEKVFKLDMCILVPVERWALIRLQLKRF